MTEDVTEYLTSEKLTETAKSLLKVWSKIQSTRLFRQSELGLKRLQLQKKLVIVTECLPWSFGR